MTATVTDLASWKVNRATNLARRLGLTAEETAIFTQSDALIARVKLFLEQGFTTSDAIVTNISIYLNGLLCVSRSLDSDEISIFYSDILENIEDALVLEVVVDNQLIYLAILGRTIINAHQLKLQDYLQLLLADS